MGILLFGASSLSDEQLHELGEISRMRVVVTTDTDEIEKIIDEVEVAVRSVPYELFRRMPNLRWYQNWFAGVEHLVGLEAFQSGRAVLTNASGVHAEPMANQFFGMLLAHARNLRFHWSNQQKHNWEKTSMQDVYELDGKSILILGYGAIGRRIGEIARVFGMTVYGVRRSPSGSNESSLKQLPDLLPRADVIVNVLPLTDETRHLCDSDFFAKCKPGAIFSSFGRGTQVDQEALLTALETNQIGVALLDVADPEPLPDTSPLWAHERVMITPHTGGWTDRYNERTWPLFIENVKRYATGESLINQIDVVAGY
jgi:phosphoglycerate dehydrogenase-like enzyme